MRTWDWNALHEGRAPHADGDRIRARGYALLADGPADRAPVYLVLMREPPCCAGHAAAPSNAVEVRVRGGLPHDLVAASGWPRVQVSGTWRELRDDPAGWRYRIDDACVTAIVTPPSGALSRRALLGLGLFSGWTGSVATAGAWAQGASTARDNAAPPPLLDPSGPAPSLPPPIEPAASANTPAWMHGTVTVDLHSHAGHVSLGRRANARPFTPVAEPMRAGGMNVIALAIVTDSSADHVVTDAAGHRRIVAYREPAPGEMAARGEASFKRLHDLVAQENLRVVTTIAQLDAARDGPPAVIVAAEGADFLEGRIDAVDDAWRRHGLRHLQLTHYRVNELGDIQTAPPVHGGLTDFGAAVIQRCNHVGMVVDVAHGTYDLVRRAASVTTRPLVLSHTSLALHPSEFSRSITPLHAKLIADTDGVIGVWPVQSIYRDLPAMAAGIHRLTRRIGVRHVGIGTDMLGLLGPSVLDSYATLPLLAQALLDEGFKPEEAQAILGGNYARVWRAALHPVD
jgi:membrane dipeptidase